MVQGPCTGLIIVYEQYTCPQNRKRRIEKVKKKKQLSYDDYFEEESDGTFYFVAGYTSGGAPYGTIWEEILASELILRAAVKNDAKPAAELIRVANGDIAELLTGKTKPQNGRFCYKFPTVCASVFHPGRLRPRIRFSRLRPAARRSRQASGASLHVRSRS